MLSPTRFNQIHVPAFGHYENGHVNKRYSFNKKRNEKHTSVYSLNDVNQRRPDLRKGGGLCHYS